jgi:hypothetical protein
MQAVPPKIGAVIHFVLVALNLCAGMNRLVFELAHSYS